VLQLELGGNNPVIVLDDADLDVTADGIVEGLTKINGQWCEGPGKVLAPRGLVDPLLDAPTERIAKLAAEFDMYVVFGMAERDRERANVLYNAAAVVGPEGVLGSYRKVHLGSRPWVTEGETFTPGNALPVWNTKHGPIGVLICYDFWLNPELSRILALKGARVIVNCTASFAGPGKRDFAVHTTEVRAAENLVFAASANLVGGPADSRNYGAEGVERPRHAAFSGCSSIAGPAFPRFNSVLAEAGDTEEIISATLNFTRLERWRSVYPWQEWRRGHQREVSELVAKEFAELY
jgi:predicted amidohydrolase